VGMTSQEKLSLGRLVRRRISALVLIRPKHALNHHFIRSVYAESLPQERPQPPFEKGLRIFSGSHYQFLESKDLAHIFVLEALEKPTVIQFLFLATCSYHFLPLQHSPIDFFRDYSCHPEMPTKKKANHLLAGLPSKAASFPYAAMNIVLPWRFTRSSGSLPAFFTALWNSETFFTGW